MNEDHEARNLLGPLAGEPGGTQRLDVGEIVRTGDRRRQRRALGTGVAAGLALVVAVGGSAYAFNDLMPSAGQQAAAYGSPSPEPSESVPTYPQPPAGVPSAPPGAVCTVARIPGADGRVMSVDRTGRWAVMEKQTPGQRTATVWKDGVKVKSVTLPKHDSTEYWINAHGDFGVIIADNQKNGQAWVFKDDKLSRLKGGGAYVSAIGDDGRVIGDLQGTGGTVIWDTPDAEPKAIPTPKGADGTQVMHVDQDNNLFGYVNVPGGATSAMWSPDGSNLQELPVTGYIGAVDNNWIVGRGEGDIGYRYDRQTKKVETLPAQGYSPTAVTPSGVLVSGSGADFWVLADGKARPLAKDPAAANYVALGITEDGRTVTGNAFSEKGDSTAVRWTCA
jgi:hypothetical protein